MSTVTQSERLLTAEEFAAEPDDRRTELVNGKVIEVPPPGFLHGLVQSEIAFLLRTYLRERDLGRPVTESGLITSRDPDSVRGPDVSFYSWNRLPKGQTPKGYADTVAEVVFEVLSPSQRLSELLEKAEEYLAAGVLCVCIVDPQRRSVISHQGDKPVLVLTEADTLPLPVPLDEWNPRVGDFFPE